MIEMKKTMMTMMAAAMMLTSATVLAATPDWAADCRDNAPCFEASYACGGGWHGGHRGRSDHGGCGGGGYCYGYDNNEG